MFYLINSIIQEHECYSIYHNITFKITLKSYFCNKKVIILSWKNVNICKRDL